MLNKKKNTTPKKGLISLKSKLKNFKLKDAILIEESDYQFKALKKIFKEVKKINTLRKSKKNKNIKSTENLVNGISINNKILFLVILNALVCYQLSGKGESYWEEFSKYIILNLENISNKNFNEKDSVELILSFIEQSKNNKRLLNIKIKRLQKAGKYFHDFIIKPEFLYKNMDILQTELAKIMNQAKTAKTIVFAVKMFSYYARQNFGYLEYFPENINIPIDSRLENLYKKFNTNKSKYKDIKYFYKDLSKYLNIPELHLDAILWVGYDEFIK